MHSINIALAIYTLESELEHELHARNISFEKHDRLYFFNVPYQPLFAQVTWIDCQKISITSINDGIKKLKALGKRWSLFSIGNHRRAQLIQDGLNARQELIPFMAPLPKLPMGGWTLIDPHTILYSTQTTSRYPLGKVEFIENKKVPSRAYLKLWEFFTVHCQPPKPKTKVIDVGSAPGGWTWVLAQLNLDVLSVDKAPLDASLEKKHNITFLKESAFALNPHDVGPARWLFSDIICYPERLLSFIQKWLQESSVDHMVCTIKFQGKADFSIIDEFLKIPGSNIVHLYHNKHELTWWKQPV